MASLSTTDVGNVFTTGSVSSPNVTTIHISTHGSMIEVNPYFIAMLPKTEMFSGVNPVFSVENLAYRGEFMNVNKLAFEALWHSYEILYDMEKPMDENLTNTIQEKINIVNGSLAEFPNLAKEAEFVGGHVSFGKPIVTTAKEEGLIIPASIAAKGDVCMVKLAVSFYDIDSKIAERLLFNVTGTAEILALELIPLRFDKEMSITKIASSPEIKIKHGENAVELGEFYKQQIVYKILKPTIMAHG